jgi:hypothetical protein
MGNRTAPGPWRDHRPAPRDLALSRDPSMRAGPRACRERERPFVAGESALLKAKFSDCEGHPRKGEHLTRSPLSSMTRIWSRRLGASRCCYWPRPRGTARPAARARLSADSPNRVVKAPASSTGCSLARTVSTTISTRPVTARWVGSSARSGRRRRWAPTCALSPRDSSICLSTRVTMLVWPTPPHLLGVCRCRFILIVLRPQSGSCTLTTAGTPRGVTPVCTSSRSALLRRRGTTTPVNLSPHRVRSLPVMDQPQPTLANDIVPGRRP